MQRVCYEKATKRIIEMQSGGLVKRRAIDKDETAEDYQTYLDDCTLLESTRLQTLVDNAVRAGKRVEDISCEYMDNAQYAAAQLADPVLQAEKAANEVKKDKLELAKTTIKTAILTENADPTKWKIEEVVARIKGIETILGLR